jgi:hypothetical protein
MEKFENHQYSRNNSSTIFGNAAILQTLGVKFNEIQWTLPHCDPVIGERPLAGFKKVKVEPAL